MTKICSFLAPGVHFEVWAKPVTRIRPAGPRLIQVPHAGGPLGWRVRFENLICNKRENPPAALVYGAERRKPGTERNPRTKKNWHAQRFESVLARFAIFRSPPGLSVSSIDARRPDLSIAEGIRSIGSILKKLWSPEVGWQIRKFHKIFIFFKNILKIHKPKSTIFKTKFQTFQNMAVGSSKSPRARVPRPPRPVWWSRPLFLVGHPLHSARPAGEFPNPVCSNSILKCM